MSMESPDLAALLAIAVYPRPWAYATSEHDKHGLEDGLAMARTTERLTAIEVKNANRKGLYPDGGGLYLKVTESKTKSWIWRYKRGGVARDMGLGAVADVSLAKARKLAGEARQKLLDGTDPLDARRAEGAADNVEPEGSAASFKECATEFISSHEVGWKNAKHRQQWRNTLQTYAYPLIGAVAAADMGTDDVLKVLGQQIAIAEDDAGAVKTARLWEARPETASRVRGRMEAVLSYAKAKGLRQGENPAQWRGHLDQLLPPRSKVRRVAHHAALPHAELPDFMGCLRENTSISARALEFTILTAARTGEALGARFDEMDLEAKVWTVPAERMKARREHRVPLSPRALAIVKAMAEIRLCPYVFPGLTSQRPLTDMALLMLLRDLRPGITTHGFRSTFKDWAAEQTSFPDFVSEAALAHVSADKVRAAYARSDLFERRCKLMTAWERFCGRAPAKVLPIKRKVRA
jgi:integrase